MSLPSLSFISYCMYRLVPGIYCTLYQFHCIYPIHRDRGFIVLPGIHLLRNPYLGQRFLVLCRALGWNQPFYLTPVLGLNWQLLVMDM